jgi:polyferredoxin
MSGRKIRYGIMVVFFGLFFALFATGRYKIDNYCIVGTLVKALSTITGSAAQHTADITYAIPAAFLVSSLLFGGWFCGYSCPIGTFQEAFYGIGRRFGLPIRVPERLDRGVKSFKYLLLAAILVGAVAFRTEIYWQFDPFRTIFVQETTTIGAVLLALTIAGAFFLNRGFCRYVCPIGAVLRVSGRVSPYRVLHLEKECIDCKKCERSCPMDIKILEKEKDLECICCNQCVDVCPTGAKVLSVGRPMRTTWYPALFLLTFAALSVAFSYVV